MALVSVEVDLTVSPPDNTTDILIEKKKKKSRVENPVKVYLKSWPTEIVR